MDEQDEKLLLKIDDDQYKEVKKFLESKNTDPTSAPNLCIDQTAVSNKTLVQFFLARKELGLTYNELLEYTSQIFTELENQRVIVLLRKVYNRLVRADNDSAEKIQEYLNITQNLNEIGPYCTKAGIYRSHIKHPVPIENLDQKFTNGALVEIEKEYTIYENYNCKLILSLIEKSVPNSTENWQQDIGRYKSRLAALRKREKRLKGKRKKTKAWNMDMELFLNDSLFYPTMPWPYQKQVSKMNEEKEQGEEEILQAEEEKEYVRRNRNLLHKLNSEEEKNKELINELLLTKEVLSEKYKELEGYKDKKYMEKNSSLVSKLSKLKTQVDQKKVRHRQLKESNKELYENMEQLEREKDELRQELDSTNDILEKYKNLLLPKHGRVSDNDEQHLTKEISLNEEYIKEIKPDLSTLEPENLDIKEIKPDLSILEPENLNIQEIKPDLSTLEPQNLDIKQDIQHDEMGIVISGVKSLNQNLMRGNEPINILSPLDYISLRTDVNLLPGKEMYTDVGTREYPEQTERMSIDSHATSLILTGNKDHQLSTHAESKHLKFMNAGNVINFLQGELKKSQNELRKCYESLDMSNKELLNLIRSDKEQKKEINRLKRELSSKDGVINELCMKMRLNFIQVNNASDQLKRISEMSKEISSLEIQLRKANQAVDNFKKLFNLPTENENSKSIKVYLITKEDGVQLSRKEIYAQSKGFGENQVQNSTGNLKRNEKLPCATNITAQSTGFKIGENHVHNSTGNLKRNEKLPRATNKTIENPDKQNDYEMIPNAKTLRLHNNVTNETIAVLRQKCVLAGEKVIYQKQSSTNENHDFSMETENGSINNEIPTYSGDFVSQCVDSSNVAGILQQSAERTNNSGIVKQNVECANKAEIMKQSVEGANRAEIVQNEKIFENSPDAQDVNVPLRAKLYTTKGTRLSQERTFTKTEGESLAGKCPLSDDRDQLPLLARKRPLSVDRGQLPLLAGKRPLSDDRGQLQEEMLSILDSESTTCESLVTDQGPSVKDETMCNVPKAKRIKTETTDYVS